MLDLDSRRAPSDAVRRNVEQRGSSRRGRCRAVHTGQVAEGVVVNARPRGQLEACGDPVGHRPQKTSVAGALEVGGDRGYVCDRVGDHIVGFVAPSDRGPVADRPASLSDRNVRRRDRAEDRLEFFALAVGVPGPHA